MTVVYMFTAQPDQAPFPARSSVPVYAFLVVGARFLPLIAHNANDPQWQVDDSVHPLTGSRKRPNAVKVRKALTFESGDRALKEAGEHLDRKEKSAQLSRAELVVSAVVTREVELSDSRWVEDLRGFWSDLWRRERSLFD